MPKGLKGEKRPADVILVAKIATREVTETTGRRQRPQKNVVPVSESACHVSMPLAAIGGLL